MKHLKTYEAKKKEEDPLYHLAVAMMEYLKSFNIPIFQTKWTPYVSYRYTSVEVWSKNRRRLFVKMDIYKTNKDIVLLQFQEETSDRLLMKILKTFPLEKIEEHTAGDVYKFSKSLVSEMIERFNIETSAKQYNL